MAKKKLIKLTPVNEFVTVHPALDFFGERAIVSVGGKWLAEYEQEEFVFESKPLCIISDGEKFTYSIQELIRHHIFHTGQLDIPDGRWDFNYVDKFTESSVSKTFPEVFQLVKDKLDYYMDFNDKRIYSLLSCFIIYTYFFPLFNFAPIMQLWGEYRTGKTKICSLLEAMIFNPVNSANISSASVFRLIESRRATIILDESEDLLGSEKARDIRNMLLAGTGKSGETYRQEKTVNDQYKTQTYKVFSPKVIANIAGVDIAALESRIIQITTSGSNNSIKANRDVNQEDLEWKEIRNELYYLCLLRFNEVIEMKSKVGTHELTGRSFKIWEGILTIASLAGIDIWKDLISYAKENKESMENEIVDFGNDPNELTTALINLCPESNDNNNSDNDNECMSIKITPTDLLEKLAKFSIPSLKDLAFKLGRYGLKSTRTRRGDAVIRCYILNREKLKKYIREVDISGIKEENNDNGIT